MDSDYKIESTFIATDRRVLKQKPVGSHSACQLFALLEADVA
jgi:hypothetical protein